MLVLRGEFGLAKKPRPTSGCPSVNHTLNAISWGTAKNDAKSLKDLLDVCTLDEETLRWAINTYKDTVSLEVKAYLLDAIGKAKKDEDVFDI